MKHYHSAADAGSHVDNAGGVPLRDTGVEAIPFEFDDFSGESHDLPHASRIHQYQGASRLTVELGKVRLSRDHVASFVSGDLVSMEADQQEEVFLRVDGRDWARGELLVVDGKIAVRVTELLAVAGQQEDLATAVGDAA
ncbi:MAG: FliM/FliN family flagellar motor switch protein [Planctomycetales bacterium]|nr:FliM/FliN family flagellar motor switch protein [Planctomycetales bacterium]